MLLHGPPLRVSLHLAVRGAGEGGGRLKTQEEAMHMRAYVFYPGVLLARWAHAFVCFFVGLFAC